MGRGYVDCLTDERALAWMPRRSPARITVDVIALIVSDCADNS